jgi:hypothetical protein
MRLLTLKCSFVLVAALLSACVDDPPPGQARDTIIWHKLGEWSGAGNLQTETFTCDSGGLRLRWETRNETRPGAGRFKMSVHSAVSGRTLDVVVEHRGVGKDIEYFSDDPRIMYVVVESKDVEWTLIVDEAVPGKVVGPGR